MNLILRRWLNNCKRRIERRLDKTDLRGCSRPMLTATNIHYEVATRTRGIAHGGIGAIHTLARQLGLIDAIDQRLHLLKIHLPYHESDHVLNIAYNPLCDGTCLQDIELRRNDEDFLDALGARRIPDPTTAGDFCRRFERRPHLHPARHHQRHPPQGLGQPTAAPSSTAPSSTWTAPWWPRPASASRAWTSPTTAPGATTRWSSRWPTPARCSAWSTAPAIGPRTRAPPPRSTAPWPSASAAASARVLLRGDTDFSQTEHLDRWDDDPRVRFIFGYDAAANLKGIAEDLPARAWRPLERPARYQVKTQPRRRPDNVKEAIVVQRGFENLRLRSEEVAEFNYRPTACQKTYRMVVVRKNISREKGEVRLFDEIRYFFYITNDWVSEAVGGGVRGQRPLQPGEPAGAVAQRGAGAAGAGGHAGEQLGVHGDDGLGLEPEGVVGAGPAGAPGRWQERHREEKAWVLGLEFKTFVNAFVRLPCQMLRTGGKLVYRLLGWNPHLPIFFRLTAALRC